MKKLYFLLLLALFSHSLIAQDTLTFEQKIVKMLELSGAKQNFDVAITQMMDLQRKSQGDILGPQFFDEMEKEMKRIGTERLLPKIVPIYRKHLTEKDIDEIIQFYESDAGQALILKMPLILSEAMEVGAEWGEEIAVEILDKIENSKELKFVKEIEADCSRFHDGNFIAIMPDGRKVKISRKNNIQTEGLGDHQLQFKVDWSGNNRYTLIKIGDKADGFPDDDLIINIYEVSETGYKYVAKMGEKDFYVEGEIMIDEGTKKM